MFILLSPAKKLDLAPLKNGVPHTEPGLLKETKELMEVTRQLEAGDLKKLMGISDGLAELNVKRFQEFSTPFTRENAKQAVLMFNGDTYQGLDAASLNQADFLFAQEHLGILSGLYGLLRPLDLIQPYRLEMGTRLGNSRGSSLYDFWGERITAQINDITKGHEQGVVINLASHEYFKAVQPKKLLGGVVTPVFKEVREGKARVIGFLAKRARGRMARYLIQNRMEIPDEMKAFSEVGYTYQPDMSTPVEYVFTRPSE